MIKGWKEFSPPPPHSPHRDAGIVCFGKQPLTRPLTLSCFPCPYHTCPPFQQVKEISFQDLNNRGTIGLKEGATVTLVATGLSKPKKLRGVIKDTQGYTANITGTQTTHDKWAAANIGPFTRMTISGFEYFTAPDSNIIIFVSRDSTMGRRSMIARTTVSYHLRTLPFAGPPLTYLLLRPWLPPPR